MTPEEKLSRIEAELIRQTGCSADEIVALYQSPIPKPVVNARMGAAHRARFTAEDERDLLRAVLQEIAVNCEQAVKGVFDPLATIKAIRAIIMQNQQSRKEKANDD